MGGEEWCGIRAGGGAAIGMTNADTAGTILVMGATGNVGAAVVRLLAEGGYAVRAAVRNVAAVRTAVPNVEYVPFDFEDSQTYAPALRGVRRLFLMRPPALSDTKRYINPVIDAAKAANVEQIVFLSLLGAEKNSVVPHRHVEKYLEASGIAWTFLRASFFMQNLSTVHRADIRDGDQIFVPAGDGRTSFVDVRDVAAVAVKALTEDGHRNKVYPLTGSQALTYGEVAQIFTAELGRPVTYPRPGALAFALRMRARGMAWGFIAVMIGIYTTARLGLAGTVTPDTAQVLGRAPISVQQFVQDERAAWR